MASKKQKAFEDKVAAMSEEQLMKEMAGIITKDILKMVEVVVEHRMQLWTMEIFKNIKRIRDADNDKRE